MNIFMTNRDPMIAAQYLDDRRVNKMILETAQMISTILVHHKGIHQLEDLVYKVTHENHTSTLWANKTMLNFNWLIEHHHALLKTFLSVSTKKHHAAHDRIHNQGIDFERYLTSDDFAAIEQTPIDVAIKTTIRRRLGLLPRQMRARNNFIDPIIQYQMVMNYKWREEIEVEGYVPKFINRQLPPFMDADLQQVIIDQKKTIQEEIYSLDKC